MGWEREERVERALSLLVSESNRAVRQELSWDGRSGDRTGGRARPRAAWSQEWALKSISSGRVTCPSSELCSCHKALVRQKDMFAS